MRWRFGPRCGVGDRGGLEPAAAIALIANAIEFLPALLGLPAVTPMSANRIVEVDFGFSDSLSAVVIPVSLGRNHAQQERAQKYCLTDSTEPLIAGHRFILERRGILHQGHRWHANSCSTKRGGRL